jgi:hypothetical protein
MLRLLLKDLKVTLIFWPLFFLFYFPYGLIFFQNHAACLAANVIFTFMLALGPTILEDQYATDPLFCSLPLKRSTIVKARYLSALTAVAVGLGLYVSYGLLLDALKNDREVSFASTLTPAGLLAFLVPVFFLVSLCFPFYFRLGLWPGLAAFLAVLLLLAAAATGLARLTAYLTGTRFSTATLSALLKNPESGTAPPAWLILAPLLLAGLVFLSLRLSIRSYSGRDL